MVSEVVANRKMRELTKGAQLQGFDKVVPPVEALLKFHGEEGLEEVVPFSKLHRNSRFWEALQLKIEIPLGLGWFRHVLSYSLGSVHSVFCNLELVQVGTLQFLSPGPAVQQTPRKRAKVSMNTPPKQEEAVSTSFGRRVSFFTFLASSRPNPQRIAVYAL